MRKITYKTLKVQNFMSVGNDTIEIEFNKGLNQIEGTNLDNPERRNAVGKSVIINAFFFALFGETVNKIKNEFIVNFHTKGKGLIELTFDVQTSNSTKSYTIKRQVKPSKVELFEGTTDKTRDSIANTNKYIADLLQTNSAIYKCCDLMTIRETVPFMDMDASDKKKFIEDIFSMNVFSLMVKDLKKLISENKSDLSVSSAKISEIKKSLDSLLDQKEKLKVQIEQRKSILEERKNELRLKLVNLDEEISKVEVIDTTEISQTLAKYRKALEKVDIELSDNRINIGYRELQISNYKKFLEGCEHITFGETCTKCFQEIPMESDYVENKKQDTIKLIEVDTKELQNLRDLSKKNIDKKTKIKEKIEEFEDIISDNEAAKQQLKLLLSKKQDLENSIESTDSDIEYTGASLDSFDESIEETEKRRDEEQKSLEDYKTTSSDLDVCKFILGEEGVKSLVIKKLLLLLNNSIEKYLLKLGMNVRCKFDEYFDEVITTNTGKTFSYKNASGAEKKTLDFACALSFADMRRKISQVYSNVIFYDEVFDNALDALGLDLIMEVIKDKIETNNLAVYVISHRKEMKKHIDGDTIDLIKEKGMTKRKV